MSWPLIAQAAQLAAPAPPSGMIASFMLGRSSEQVITGAEILEWDVIRYQSGFSPVLSGTITTVTVPAGANRAILRLGTGSGNADTANYIEGRIQKNGAFLNYCRNAWHDSYYSRSFQAAVVDCVPGDTFEGYLNNSNGGNNTGSLFAGSFYAA